MRHQSPPPVLFHPGGTLVSRAYSRSAADLARLPVARSPVVTSPGARSSKTNMSTMVANLNSNGKSVDTVANRNTRAGNRHVLNQTGNCADIHEESHDKPPSSSFNPFYFLCFTKCKRHFDDPMDIPVSGTCFINYTTICNIQSCHITYMLYHSVI